MWVARAATRIMPPRRNGSRRPPRGAWRTANTIWVFSTRAALGLLVTSAPPTAGMRWPPRAATRRRCTAAICSGRNWIRPRSSASTPTSPTGGLALSTAKPTTRKPRATPGGIARATEGCEQPSIAPN